MTDPTFWLLIVVLVLMLWPWPKGRGKYEAQLARHERKLNALLKHLNIDLNPGVDPQVVKLAQSGQKIEAIKLYREQTGVGLKEAKDYIEGL